MRKESFQGILLGIVIMCAVFAFITVAWAAFQTNLTISGTASVTAQTWKVDFTNTKDSDFNTAATAAGTAFLLPTASNNSTNAVLDASSDRFRITAANVIGGKIGTFNQGGDKITYTWYIQNFGTFNANVAVAASPNNGGFGETPVASGGNIQLTCYTSTGSSAAPDKNDWCNGTTGESPTAGNMKATLKFGSSAVTSTATNIAKATATSDDTDVIEVTLEVEFVNSTVGDGNHSLAPADMTVEIPTMTLVARQGSAS